jgi:citrate lyase beta subunit
VFTPNPKDLATAQRIVAALWQSHGGACQLNGRKIEVPVVKAVQRTVALARQDAA